jgi:hypothetical protein
MSREPSHDDNNVTVIEVSNNQYVPHSAIPLDYQGVFNFNFVEDALPSVPHMVPTGSSTFHENLDFREELELNDTFYTPPVTPARTAEIQHQMPPSVTTEQDLTSSLGNGQIEVTDSGNSYYECVFLPNAAESPQSLDPPVSVASNSAARSRLGSDVVEVAPESTETSSVRSLHPGNTVTEVRVQESVTATDQAFTDTQQRRRRRSSLTSEIAASLSSGGSHALRVAAVTGAERNRAAAQRVDAGRRLQPAPHPYRQAQVCSCRIICRSYHI